MLEIHIAGKSIEKRQNFDPSKPPGSAEHLHFPLNGETRRSPQPPVLCTQMAWEDADKVSLAVHHIPTDNPGPEQHSPLDRQTHTQGKKRN
jgi:hypothetical protein